MCCSQGRFFSHRWLDENSPARTSRQQSKGKTNDCSNTTTRRSGQDCSRSSRARPATSSAVYNCARGAFPRRRSGTAAPGGPHGGSPRNHPRHGPGGNGSPRRHQADPSARTTTRPPLPCRTAAPSRVDQEGNHPDRQSGARPAPPQLHSPLRPRLRSPRWCLRSQCGGGGRRPRTCSSRPAGAEQTGVAGD